MRKPIRNTDVEQYRKQFRTVWYVLVNGLNDTVHRKYLESFMSRRVACVSLQMILTILSKSVARAFYEVDSYIGMALIPVVIAAIGGNSCSNAYRNHVNENGEQSIVCFIKYRVLGCERPLVIMS